MSSTNRGNAKDRHIADYYITPIEDIKIFLNVFGDYEFLDYNRYDILDCCAGGDSINPMSYPEALKHFGVDKVSTIDIRKDSLAEIKHNYLELDCKNKFNMIITNPPFNISIDIIKKALDDVKVGGYVIMLLRLNYLESVVRKKFWDENMCKYAFVHHKRMSFKQNGQTDSIAYCHFVWQKGYDKNYCKTFII